MSAASAEKEASKKSSNGEDMKDGSSEEATMMTNASSNQKDGEHGTVSNSKDFKESIAELEKILDRIKSCSRGEMEEKDMEGDMIMDDVISNRNISTSPNDQASQDHSTSTSEVSNAAKKSTRSKKVSKASKADLPNNKKGTFDI